MAEIEGRREFSPDEWAAECLNGMDDSHLAGMAGPQFRHAVLEQRAKIPGDAIPRLIGMLQWDNRTGVQAALCLIALGMPALVALVAELDSGDPKRQCDALHAIEGFGEGAAPALGRVETLLTSDDTGVRAQAAMALRRIDPGHPDLERFIVDGLDADVTSYYRGLWHLCQFEQLPRDLLPRLAQMLRKTRAEGLVEVLRKQPELPVDVINALKDVAAVSDERYASAREAAREALRNLGIESGS